MGKGHLKGQMLALKHPGRLNYTMLIWEKTSLRVLPFTLLNLGMERSQHYSINSILWLAILIHGSMEIVSHSL
jgi:hypothetical protein